jgi:hypothetical protein
VAQTIRGLERCPLHQFPLTAALSGHSEEDRDRDRGGTGGGGDNGGGNVANADRERKKGRPLYSPVQADSEAARLYGAMADDVILEIAKQSVTAALIPSLSYQAGRGEGGSIVLRYFGASSVTEYVVPAWQVRDRDPLTGGLLPDAPSEEERQRRYSDSAGVHPVTFDVKGNYGVSIVWSDGHYADIFPFDVLSKLAEELSVN